MTVSIDFFDDTAVEVKCFSFLLNEGRLYLRNEEGNTIYCVNEGQWISFEVTYQ